MNRITNHNGSGVSDTMDDYLTPRQAAERKGVSVPTIYKAIERGALPSVRVLDRVALRPADVEAYEPGSYGCVKRAVRRRGPGRGPKPEANTEKAVNERPVRSTPPPADAAEL